MTTATVIKSMTGRTLYKEISRPKVIQRFNMTPDQEKRMNQRLAPLINSTYIVAFIIESISTDIKHDRLKKVSSRLRALISESSPNHADEYGEWGDMIEHNIMQLGDRREILYILCDKFYRMARQMEQTYRQIEPLFDFYQINEAKQLLAYTKGKKLNTELYKDINLVIDKIKKS